MRKPSASGKAKGGRGGATVAALKPKGRVAARAARPAGQANGSARASRRPAVAKVARVAEQRVERPQPARFADAEPAATGSRGKYVYCIIEAIDALRFGP